MSERETVGLRFKTETVLLVLVIIISCDILKKMTLSDGEILFVLSLVADHLIYFLILLVQLYLVLRWPSIIFFLDDILSGSHFPANQDPLFSIDTLVLRDPVTLPGGISVFVIEIYGYGIWYQFTNLWNWKYTQGYFLHGV